MDLPMVMRRQVMLVVDRVQLQIPLSTPVPLATGPVEDEATRFSSWTRCGLVPPAVS